MNALTHIHPNLTSRRLIPGVLTASLLAVGTYAATITPVQFTPNNPIGGGCVGFTFAGNKFVGSVLDNGTGQNLLYSTDLSGGSITPFGGAVTLAPTYGSEHYVAASFGLGGFANGDVFVASGNNIVHLSNTGASLGNFINGSTGGLNGDVRGIAFDTVGTFGYNMLVTTHAGGVYTVDSLGNATLIASTGEDTEGLDVAPLGGIWGGKNGWLFVASEGNLGTIRAIDFAPAHTMITIANVQSAEQLSFVPLNLGASGSPLEGMYSADYPTNVMKMAAGQFAGLQGHLIITGETTSDIWDLTPGGATLSGNFPSQPEDGIFVTAAMVPEPTVSALLGIGTFSVMILRRRSSARDSWRGTRTDTLPGR